jgi:hypothetical protein
MAAVTRERITRVQVHVTDAVLKTTERSTLSGPEQDALLAQACAESCDLFTDWLASDYWMQARPRNRTALVAEAMPQGEDYARFLDPLLADMLARGALPTDGLPGDGLPGDGLPGDGLPGDAAELVTSAREAVQRMARRHPRWQQPELFREADSRIRALRADVCALATSLKNNLHQDEQTHKRTKEARRSRALAALKRTLAVIPALTLAMAGATPAQMDANLHVWTHDAVRVVGTYLIAQQAQPDVEIGPPGLSGPQLGPR